MCIYIFGLCSPRYARMCVDFFMHPCLLSMYVSIVSVGGEATLTSRSLSNYPGGHKNYIPVRLYVDVSTFVYLCIQFIYVCAYVCMMYVFNGFSVRMGCWASLQRRGWRRRC